MVFTNAAMTYHYYSGFIVKVEDAVKISCKAKGGINPKLTLALPFTTEIRGHSKESNLNRLVEGWW